MVKNEGWLDFCMIIYRYYELVLKSCKLLSISKNESLQNVASSRL